MANKIALIYVVLLTFNLDVISCEMKCSGLLEKNSTLSYITSTDTRHCVSDISCVFYNTSLHIKWTLPLAQKTFSYYSVSYREENGVSGYVYARKNETSVTVYISVTPNASYSIDIYREYNRQGDTTYSGFNTSRVCRAPHIIERYYHERGTNNSHRKTITKKQPTTTHRYETMNVESTTAYLQALPSNTSSAVTIRKNTEAVFEVTTRYMTSENITRSIVIRFGSSKTGSLLPVIAGIGGAIILVSSTVIILCVMFRQKQSMNKYDPKKTHGETRSNEDDVYNHMTRPSTARMSLQTNGYDDTYDHMDDVTCDHVDNNTYNHIDASTCDQMDNNTYDHMDDNPVNAINIRINNKACDQRRTTPGTDINKESDPQYDLAVLHVQDDKNEVNSLLNPYACASKSVMKGGGSSDVNISRQSGPKGDLYTVVAITNQ